MCTPTVVLHSGHSTSSTFMNPIHVSLPSSHTFINTIPISPHVLFINLTNISIFAQDLDHAISSTNQIHSTGSIPPQLGYDSYLPLHIPVSSLPHSSFNLHGEHRSFIFLCLTRPLLTFLNGHIIH